MFSKNFKLIVAFSFLFVLQIQLYAQNFNIGLGFTLEHPQDIQYERMSSTLKLQKLYIPVTLLSRIRIIPEFAYWNTEFKNSGYETFKYSVLHAGIGLYYLHSLRTTSIYTGPRIAIVNIKNPSENRPPNIITSKIDHTFGATFGAEYNLLKNISIGFEIQYNYYEINPWTDFGYEETTIKRAFETVFVFSFHI